MALDNLVTGIISPFAGVEVVIKDALPAGTVMREKNQAGRLFVAPDVAEHLCRHQTLPDDVQMYEIDPAALLTKDLFDGTVFKREVMGGWEDSLAAAGRLDQSVLNSLHRDSVLAATVGGWEIRLVPPYHVDGTVVPLEHMSVYIDAKAKRSYVGHDTYETLSYDEGALQQFYEDMTKGAGMKRLVRDAGKYRDAALAELRAKGLDAVEPAGDTLDSLLAEANALLTQAGSLNRKPSPLVLQIFAERLATLNAGVAAAREKFDRLEAAASLAALAVMDSTE